MNFYTRLLNKSKKYKICKLDDVFSYFFHASAQLSTTDVTDTLFFMATITVQINVCKSENERHKKNVRNKSILFAG